MATIEISRAGTSATSMEGVQVPFTSAMLAEVAATYNPALHEAPMVMGHPTHDAPAFGWVKGVSFSDPSLAVEGDPHPELVEAVRGGKVRKVSASFFTPNSPNNPTPGKWHLRHVGFLGAMTPAVKGLRQVSFADDAEVMTLELDEVSFGDLPSYFGTTVARMFGRFRDWLIAKEGLEAADKVIGSWEVDSLSEMAQRAQMEGERKPGLTSFADASPAASAAPSTAVKGPLMSKTPEQLQAELDAAKAELAARDKADADRAAAERHAAHVSFADGLVAEAKWPAGAKDVLVATLDHLATPGANTGVVSFGDGDAAKPLADALREQLQAMPAAVSFGELAKSGSKQPDAQDASALADKAKALIEENARKGITINAAEAVAQLQGA